jgi:hypothetical protein
MQNILVFSVIKFKMHSVTFNTFSILCNYFKIRFVGVNLLTQAVNCILQLHYYNHEIL